MSLTHCDEGGRLRARRGTYYHGGGSTADRLWLRADSNHAEPVRDEAGRARAAENEVRRIRSAQAEAEWGERSIARDVVTRADGAAARPGGGWGVRGDAAVARQALKGGARGAAPALVNGTAGLVIAPLGQLLLVLRFTLAGARIIEIEAVGDPERLAQLEIALPDD
jgi:hypothetical protein